MSKEKVLAAIDSKVRPVKEIVSETGLSESVVRKALKDLVAHGKITQHDTKPTLFSNPNTDPFSLEQAVAQVLGRRARSVDYLHKRLANRGHRVTKVEVGTVLLALVSKGQAVSPFSRSQRYAKA